MSVFLEGRLCFEFGSSWQVEKYDEHSSYRQGIARLSGGVVCEKCQRELECPDCHRAPGGGTKAVDFVGRRSNNDGQLYFIEVKDFRGHAVESRGRIGDALATEVAFKVRDTLAGLVGIYHCAKRAQEWICRSTWALRRRSSRGRFRLGSSNPQSRLVGQEGTRDTRMPTGPTHRPPVRG